MYILQHIYLVKWSMKGEGSEKCPHGIWMTPYMDLLFLLKYFAFSNHCLDELELSHFLCKNIYRVEAVPYGSGYIRFVLNWLILILCEVFFGLKWSMKLSIFQVILRERYGAIRSFLL